MDYFNHQSERLQFRALTKANIENWISFFHNNDMQRFVAVDESKPPIENATLWITKQMERYEESGLGLLAVYEKSSTKFIGLGGIIPREIEGNPFEIAYSLLPEFWNNGYATELATHLKKTGIQLKIANKFVSIIHKENHPSMNVARKNGFKKLKEIEYMGMECFLFGDF
jgi:ribosomal-protein-alanine N-acetyltransferase